MTHPRHVFGASLLAALLLAGPAAQAQTATQGQPFAVELAKSSLAKDGIEAPTPQQLDTAVKSIEAQRASGMGWGEIANSMGLHLGHVISAYARSKNDDDSATDGTKTKSRAKTSDDAKETETEKHAFHERAEKSERTERSERGEHRGSESRGGESRGGEGRGGDSKGGKSR